MKKALIALTLALLLIALYQQSQIGSLKADYKVLNTDRLDLLNRVQALEMQNQELMTALKQIDSRLGYMDSKVTGAFEERNKPQHQLERVNPAPQMDRSEDPENPEPHKEGGIMDSIRRIFN
jgi:hypothetical protein